MQGGAILNIGNIIQQRRKELKLTLEDIGNFVGVGKSTVKKWESGYIENMKRDKISLLSQILQLNPVTFITGEITYLQQENISENSITDEEQIILKNYNKLNRDGKNKANDYIKDLVATNKYKK